MKQLFSKAGVSSLAFIAVFVVVLGMFVMNIFENYQERREVLTEKKNAGTPIALVITQEINWKNTMNSLDKITWTDGKSYSFDKDKPIEEQNVPDFIKLTQSEDKYPTKTCSEKYDVCGAIMRVKDANTGEVITTIKDEEMVDKGNVMFSILGDLIEEQETTTTSDRVWKKDLEKDPAITKLYTDLIYDVEIYTIKDGERVVQGTVSGETHRQWLLGIKNIAWNERVSEDIGRSIVVHSYVSVRTW